MIGRARAVLLGVAVAIASVLGCGSGAAPQTGFTGTPCSGPLDVVGMLCPTTFDGTLAGVACDPFLGLRAFKCGDALLLLESGGPTAAWCVYDPTSHALVGATVTTDSPLFCDGQSAQEFSGKQVDPACVLGTPLATRACDSNGVYTQDGGVDAADGGGADAADAGADAADAPSGDGAARDGGDDAAVSE
jgi:hypothetical protein